MIRSFIPIGISLLVIPFLISCNVITVPSNAATDTYFEEGVGLYQSGEYELALYAFSRDLSLDARSFRSYAYRAITYHTLGQYESAIQDYNSAILLKSDYPYTYHNRAIAYFELGMYDLSMSDYQTAVALGLVGPVVYNNIGLVSFYQKNLDIQNPKKVNIKINNKVIHQSKLLNYFKKNYEIKKIEKETNNLIKSVKRKKNYSVTNKDLMLLESLQSDGVKISKKYQKFIVLDQSNVPTDIQLLINNSEIAMVLLRIVETIGEDDLNELSSDTLYFIISVLNQLNIDPIRNNILLKILPLKV